MNTVLTIAGSDSCGGAGIQADLKTFAALRTYGLSVITAVTAQNTCGVMAIREMDREIIQAQMDAIYADIPVAAVKIGMLSSREIVCVVAAGLARYRAEKVVLDPVMLSKSGRSLLSDEAVASLKTDLIPQACVVTPNLPEAEALAGFAVTDEASMLRAAKLIYEMGAKHVVIKGGHLKGAAADLFYDGKTVEVFFAGTPDSETYAWHGLHIFLGYCGGAGKRLKCSRCCCSGESVYHNDDCAWICAGQRGRTDAAFLWII